MKISTISSLPFLSVASGVVVAAVFAGAAGIVLAQTVSAPVCSLSASPSVISSGQSATLSWTSSGATDAVFDQGLGQAASPSGGSMSVSPSSTVTYAGTFTGAYGSTTCQAIITVSPVMATTTGNLFPTNNAIVPGIAATVTAPTVPVVSPPAVVSAPAVSTAPAVHPATGTTPAPMVMSVGSNGSILLRAPVRLVGTNSIVVDGWGGPWIIRTSASTRVISNALSMSGDVSMISVGDFVGIEGTVASDQIYTVDAVLIRDWTTHPYIAPAVSAVSAATSSAAIAPTTGAPVAGNLYTGTVTDIGIDSVTLTDPNGTVYSVTVGTSTAVWNTARKTIPLSSIESGDSIRVNGTLSGSTVSATVVRDISR